MEKMHHSPTVRGLLYHRHPKHGRKNLNDNVAPCSHRQPVFCYARLTDFRLQQLHDNDGICTNISLRMIEYTRLCCTSFRVWN